MAHHSAHLDDGFGPYHDSATYPSDRNRGASPTARAWAVARGEAPGSHYVLTESWADQRGRYSTGEIVARGLTLAEALAHMRVLNAACGGGPGAGLRIKSGGRPDIGGFNGPGQSGGRDGNG